MYASGTERDVAIMVPAEPGVAVVVVLPNRAWAARGFAALDHVRTKSRLPRLACRSAYTAAWLSYDSALNVVSLCLHLVVSGGGVPTVCLLRADRVPVAWSPTRIRA